MYMYNVNMTNKHFLEIPLILTVILLINWFNEFKKQQKIINNLTEGNTNKKS